MKPGLKFALKVYGIGVVLTAAGLTTWWWLVAALDGSWRYGVKINLYGEGWLEVVVLMTGLAAFVYTWWKGD